MDVNRVLPQSVFNTQSEGLVRFLNRPTANERLYQHQIEAVLRAKAQLQDPTKPNIALIVLPTGCGKTGVAVLAAYALNASRVLIITPSVKISIQIHEAFCGSRNRSCFLLEREIIKKEQVNQVRPYGACIYKTETIAQHMADPFMVVNAHKIGGQSTVQIKDIPNNSYDLVIVDEAHHYPAPTWKLLVDHFGGSNRLFLTATPEHNGEAILDFDPCYQLSRGDAVGRGIIRDVCFDEVPYKYYSRDPQLQDAMEMQDVAECVSDHLDSHDREDPNVQHQAMVLTQTIHDIRSATLFREQYRSINPDACEMYVNGTSAEVLQKFERGEIRTLIIIGKLLEGYDNKRVSVVAIVRNVARKSKVLFSQFVGRAVRKARRDDPITTWIVSHQNYNQRENFDQFDAVAEEEYIDVDY